MQAGLSQPGSTWYMLRLSNMSTVTREWVALHSVRDLKFQDILLSAKTSATRRTSKLLIPQVIVFEKSFTGYCKPSVLFTELISFLFVPWPCILGDAWLTLEHPAFCSLTEAGIPARHNM